MKRALLIVIFGLTIWLSGFAKPDNQPKSMESERSLFDCMVFYNGMSPAGSILDLQLIPLSGKVEIRWKGQDLASGMKVLVERKSARSGIQLVGGLTYRMSDLNDYQFSFEDRDPLDVKQVSYRVIHIYPDGQRVLSEWQALFQEGTQLTRTYPNPATNFIQFDWSFSSVSELQVKLLTVSGQEVGPSQLVASQGLTDHYHISIISLQPGNYLLYATDGAHHWASRFVKR